MSAVKIFYLHSTLYTARLKRFTSTYCEDFLLPVMLLMCDALCSNCSTLFCVKEFSLNNKTDTGSRVCSDYILIFREWKIDR